LEYGNLGSHRHQLFKSLRIMGRVIGRTERADAVINFFDSTIRDLTWRTSGVTPSHRPTCFVGGIAYKGPHGFRSTGPGYPL
jgi:iron complex transport system substrate-binding protein